MFALLKVLADAKIEFVLVGGLATALQGYQRVTIEVVLAMDGGNLQKFLSVAKANNLHPTMPVDINMLAQPELIEQ